MSPDALAFFTNIPNPYNRHLFAALRERGWDVAVVYKGDPASEGRRWAVEVDARDTVARRPSDERRALARCRADGRAVILTGSYAGLVEAERRLWFLRQGPALYFWGERLAARRGLLDLYRRLYFAGLRGILAVGSWAVDGYRAVAPRVPVHVLPYTTMAPPDAVARRQPAPAPVVGFVGDLTARKGVDILIDGLARLPAADRPALEVVGDGPERADLARRAGRAAVAVTWRGHLGDADLDDARLGWWAQAVPSRYDGWGVVVSEAMAAGVPVLASTNVGAAVDLVRDGYNGVRVGTDDEWSEAIRRYTDADVVRRESIAAAEVGRAFGAGEAAAWLTQLLAEPRSGAARSFVEDAWRAVDRARDGGTAPA